MKEVFVRYSIHECIGKVANGTLSREMHISDIIDIEEDKVDDLQYIKDKLSEMYGFFTNQIEIKYIKYGNSN